MRRFIRAFRDALACKTDTKRLDHLASRFGCGVMNDDNGHWAFVGAGWQNVPMGRKPEDMQITLCIDAADWQDSLRGVIDDDMKPIEMKE